MEVNQKYSVMNSVFVRSVCCLILFILTHFLTIAQNNPITQKSADSLYSNSNDFEKTAHFYQELFERETESNEQKGVNAFKAGKSLKKSGDFKNAEVWFKKASEVFRKLKNWDKYYISQFQIAGILDDQGDYENAVKFYHKCAEHFKQQKDSSSAAGTLNNLGLSYYHLGKIKKAITLFDEAIIWYGDNNDSQKALCYNQLGNIWADDLKDEKKALEYYRKSLKLKLGTATPQSIAAAYNNIGVSHKNLDRPDSAIYYYQKALYFAIKSGISGEQVNPLINLANLKNKMGKPKEAIEFYRQLIALKDDISQKKQIDIYLNFGIILNEQRLYDEALKTLKIAERILIKSSNFEDLANVKAQLALANFGLGNFDKAYADQVEFARLKDSLHTQKMNERIAELMIKYDVGEKDRELLRQQQIMQENELRMSRRTTWFISTIALILLLIMILFYLLKRKKALAEHAQLQLQILKQNELSKTQQERLRISRELHDNIGSYLTLMSASTEQLLLTDSASPRIKELQNTLKLSMNELRKTVWLINQKAVSVDEIALKLRDFFSLLQQNGVRISVSVIDEAHDLMLSDVQTTYVFRVIQEAVSNSYKYASCEEITIELGGSATDGLKFSVRDDGNGFNPQTVKEGNGLQNMKSRIQELQGELHVKSTPEGTIVSGKFPLEK